MEPILVGLLWKPNCNNNDVIINKFVFQIIKQIIYYLYLLFIGNLHKTDKIYHPLNGLQFDK